MWSQLGPSVLWSEICTPKHENTCSASACCSIPSPQKVWESRPNNGKQTWLPPCTVPMSSYQPLPKKSLEPNVVQMGEPCLCKCTDPMCKPTVIARVHQNLSIGPLKVNLHHQYTGSQCLNTFHYVVHPHVRNWCSLFWYAGIHTSTPRIGKIHN